MTAPQYMTLGLTLRANADITVANVQDMANAFRAAFPSGKLTWVLDETNINSATAPYPAVRAQIASYCSAHGDAVAYWVIGGFPAITSPGAAQTLTQIRALLDSYMPLLAAAFPTSPPLIAGWHLPADTLSYARSNYGVKTAWMQVWSQSGVDGFTGTDSPNVPYFPSRNHSLVPAQAGANQIDLVALDTISQDLWASQTTGNSSRSGLHPHDAMADTGSKASGLTEMETVTSAYLSDPNPIRHISNLVEMDWIYDATSADIWIYNAGDFPCVDNMKSWFSWLAATYPNLNPVTIEEFGTEWRSVFPANTWAWLRSAVDRNDATKTIYYAHTAARSMALVSVSGGAPVLAELVRYSDAETEPTAPAPTWTPTTIQSQKATFQPATPYTVAAYRDLVGLLKSYPALAAYARQT